MGAAGGEGAGYCAHVNVCVCVRVRQPGEPDRSFIYTDISQRWWQNIFVLV